MTGYTVVIQENNVFYSPGNRRIEYTMNKWTTRSTGPLCVFKDISTAILCAKSGICKTTGAPVIFRVEYEVWTKENIPTPNYLTLASKVMLLEEVT